MQCPAGSYCPSPAQLIACPPGSFCSEGVARPLPCSYDTLLRTDSSTIVVERRTVLERLHLGQDEVHGNFCPAGSQVPSAPCKRGFFCPAPSVQVACEAGYYCPEGSTEQRRCRWLAHCPAGTARPRFSYAAVLLIAVMLAAALALWRALCAWDRSVSVCAADPVCSNV